jgi:hypothetical protein
VLCELQLALCCFLILCSIARAEPLDTIVADGPRFKAQIARIDADGKLHLEGSEPRELPLNELVRWGNFVEPVRGPQILLLGGGLLVADIAAIDKDQLEADSDPCGAVKLPLSLVSGVVFSPPGDLAARDKLLAKLRGAAAGKDRVILDNGDELPGTIEGLKDDTLSLQTEAGKLQLPIKRLTAVILDPALADKGRPVGPVTMLGLRDGSRLPVASLSAADQKLQLNLNQKLALSCPLDRLVAIQPLGGRAVYLSDLKAASFRHLPFLSTAWPYKLDQSVDGGQLRAGGKLWLKGLGMHSASRLTYELDGQFARFQAEAAIDQSTGGKGSVVVKVLTDAGDGKWQAKHTSPVLRGGDSPHWIDVDLSSARRLSLLVEFADRGDEQDHLDWLDARLIRR